MNWLDTFCFISVARTQSFSLTAQELMISQQAVSRHINKLEEEVGYPLFLRNYHSSVLTKAGEILLEYLAKQDALQEQLQQTFSHTRQEQLLRIGWCQWMGCPAWFKAAIMGFQKANPAIQILTYDLHAQEQATALEKGSIDVLLTSRYTYQHLPVVWGATPVAELPMLLVGGKHLQYQPELLAYYPHIAAYAGEADEAAVRARVIREYEKLGAVPQRIEVVPEMASACMNALLKNGLTIGIRIDPVQHAHQFTAIPMDRTVTAVLCRSYQTDNSMAEQFEQFLLEEQEVIL